MNKNLKEMSMVEIAEMQMLSKRTPQKFEKIVQEVSEILGLSHEDLERRIGRFYADLTLSGKFIPVGDGKWDLKSRQKFEVGDKVQNLIDDSEEDHHFILDDEEEDEEEEANDDAPQ